MMKLKLLIGSTIGIVGILFGFLGTHFWLSSKMEAQRTYYEGVIGSYREQSLLTAELKATIEHGFQDAAKKARDDATQAKADSDARFIALNIHVNGLRNDIARTKQAISEAPRASVDQYAGTAGRLFATCLQEYVWMANRANKHRIDLIEHRDAWPRYPESGTEMQKGAVAP